MKRSLLIPVAVAGCCVGGVAQQFSPLRHGDLPMADTDGYALAAGDVDGDGDVDLVFPRNFAAPLLYRNLGGGRFVGDSIGFSGQNDVRAALLIDYDGDGDLDLVLKRASGSAVLWRNSGGTFTDLTATAMPTVSQSSTTGMVAGDIDGDGDLDLLLTGSGVVLLVNNGNGTFSNGSPARLPSGSTTWPAGEAAVADFDGDGDVDVAIPRRSASGPTQHHILLVNDGSGFFTEQGDTRLPPLGAGQYPGALSLAAGDVDGDGDQDIVVSREGDELGVYRNDGSGLFAGPEPIQVLGVMHAPYTRVPDRLRLGDVDGDGDLDLVCIAAGAYGRHLYRNDGAGHFSPGDPYALPQGRQLNRGQLLVDVDGDGDLDLVQCSFGSTTTAWYETAHAVLFNDGRGRFVDAGANAIDHTADEPTCLAAIDLDRDGLCDLVRGIRTSGSPATKGMLWAMRSTGEQSFVEVARIDYDQDLGQPMTLAVGDADGDGWSDVYVSLDSGANLLLLNDGAGNLVQGGTLPTTTSWASNAAFADVDGDGDLDLLTTRLFDTLFSGPPDRTTLWLNDGTGTFTDATSTHLPVLPDRCPCMTVFDLEGDGDLDVFTGVNSSFAGVQDRVLVNDGTGHFTNEPSRAPLASFGYTNFVRAADVDGDGQDDLVVQGSGSLRIWLADGSGSLVDATSQWNPFGYSSGPLEIGDFDGDGRIDVLRGGQDGILHNTGAQFMNRPNPYASPFIPQHNLGQPVAADFDGDGDVDIALSTAQFDNVQWNLRLQTDLPYLARPGAYLPIRVHAAPGTATSVQLAAVAVSLGRAAVPTPFGTMWLDPTQPLLSLQACLLPAPAGVGQVEFWIPPWNFLQGVSLTMQSLVLGADLTTASFTNAISTTIR